MPLIAQSVPTLTNGVSQQSPALRAPSQGDEQINCYSTLVNGLTKRPPFKHLAKLGIATPSRAMIDIIDDPDEQLIVIATDGDLKVYDFQGNEKTVSFPDGKTYLETTKPDKKIRMRTIGDYTFILNKSKLTRMDTTTGAAETPAGVVWVKSAVNGQKYTITLDGSNEVSTTLSDSGVVDTDDVASSLTSKVNNDLTGYTATQNGPLIQIEADNGSDFELEVKDSWGNAAMTALKGSVQTTAKLPEKFWEDITVKVQGDAAKQEDSYYMKWVTDSGTSTGAWIETVKPGLANDLDNAYLPHALVNNGDGTFTFEKVSWERRKVGDMESIEPPSFIGRKITDIIFWKNRLGFLAGENVVLSRAGDFFNFWPETASAVLDSDPVDVAATSQFITTLRHAVPFDESLLLFSDRAQLRLNNDGVVSPKSVSVDETTTYASSPDVTPVSVGNNVYFVVERGKKVSVREYFVDEETVSNKAADVTGHVPNYVPANVFAMAASTNEDVLFAVSSDEANRLFVYKFYWDGNEKVVSSWSKWALHQNDEIVGVQVVDTVVYALIKRDDDLYIETCDLQYGLTDTGFEFEVLIDRKTALTGSHDPTPNETTWTLPYAIPTEVPVTVVLGAAFGTNAGTKLVTERPSATTVRAFGEHTAGIAHVGLDYAATYRFSRQFVRDSEGTAVQTGALQMRTMTVAYEASGYFRAEVTPKFGETYRYEYTGLVLGAGLVLGQVPLGTGSWQFPVMNVAGEVTIELINDSYLPSNFLWAEWEALYHNRAARSL